MSVRRYRIPIQQAERYRPNRLTLAIAVLAQTVAVGIGLLLLAGLLIYWLTSGAPPA